jgi:hypothetical protein
MRYDNLLDLIKDTNNQQLTAQNIINERVYFNSIGWGNVELTHEVKEGAVNMIVSVIGGQLKSQIHFKNLMMNRKPQHWGFERIVFEIRIRDEKETVVCSYIPGQSEESELQMMR